jgi:hypothetical protein
LTLIKNFIRKLFVGIKPTGTIIPKSLTTKYTILVKKKNSHFIKSKYPTGSNHPKATILGWPSYKKKYKTKS